MNPTAVQMDALQEQIDMGIGRAAGILSDMLGLQMDLRVPVIKLLLASETPTEIPSRGAESMSWVRLSFSGPFSGTAHLLFTADCAQRLAAMMTHEDPVGPELEAVRWGALEELGNVVLNGVMGTVVNLLSEQLEFGLPWYTEATAAQVVAGYGPSTDVPVLLVRAQFSAVNQDVEGNVLIMTESGAFDRLLEAVDRVTATGEDDRA